MQLKPWRIVQISTLILFSACSDEEPEAGETSPQMVSHISPGSVSVRPSKSTLEFSIQPSNGEVLTSLDQVELLLKNASGEVDLDLIANVDL